MKKQLLGLVVTLLCIMALTTVKGQGTETFIRNDTLTFRLKRLDGLGPSGFSTAGIQPVEKESQYTPYKALPVLTNIPPGIDSVRYYFHEINGFQLAFQAYVAGVVNKEYLVQRASTYGWRLQDTAGLSRKPVSCGIALVTGQNKNSEPIYIVDANNNGDLADDTLKILTKAVYNQTAISQHATPVDINYTIGGKVEKTRLLVTVNAGYNRRGHELSLFFPQFLFGRVQYRDQQYIIVSNGFQIEQYICFLPDRPYFTNVNAAEKVIRGRPFRIGEDIFQLVSYNEFTGEITIAGKDVVNFHTGGRVNVFGTSVARGIKAIQKAPVLGFLAPALSGKLITPGRTGSVISLNSLRGKYVFVDFWATYCGPCIEELPFLREVYHRFSRQKFEIIGVLDENDKEAALNLLSKHQVSWPTIIQRSPTTNIKGYEPITSYPRNYLIGPDGEIVAVDLRGDQLTATLAGLMGIKK